MKIFVDTDADIRLSRRLKRDIINRGRNMKDVLEQYNRHVKPAFDYYIAPSMIHADLIVPRGGENEVAIKLIVQHVQTQFDARGFKLREQLASMNGFLQLGNGDGNAANASFHSFLELYSRCRLNISIDTRTY